MLPKKKKFNHPKVYIQITFFRIEHFFSTSLVLQVASLNGLGYSIVIIELDCEFYSI